MYLEVALVFDIKIHKRKRHRCPLPGLEPWSTDLITCSALHWATWTPTMMYLEVALVFDITIHVEIKWHHITLSHRDLKPGLLCRSHTILSPAPQGRTCIWHYNSGDVEIITGVPKSPLFLYLVVPASFRPFWGGFSLPKFNFSPPNDTNIVFVLQIEPKICPN